MSVFIMVLVATAGDDLSSECPSIVSKVFEGRMMNSIQCLSCHKVSVQSLVLQACDAASFEWNLKRCCFSELFISDLVFFLIWEYL